MKPENMMSEAELDQAIEEGRLAPVENHQPMNPSLPRIPPIPTSIYGNQSPYLSATIPIIGLQPDELRNTLNHGVPFVRVMPVAPAGVPSQNVVAQPAHNLAQDAATQAANANTSAQTAKTTATGAATGVATINGQAAVAIVAGLLQQVPISTLGTSSATPTQDNLNDGSTFGRVVNTALTSNQIDTTKVGFLARLGAFPPTIVGTTASIFTYTSTTTSITLAHSTFTVLFSDQTTQSVTGGSTLVTGLSPSTTYYFYPFINAAFNVSFALVAGGNGSPAIMYSPQSPTAASAMNAQNVSALAASGVMAITPTSGSGGGSGGGSGICLRAGQFVESESRGIIAIEDVEVGEFIRGRMNWTEVICKKVIPQSHFVRVTVSTGERIVLTPSHCTTAIRNGEEMSIPAGQLNLSDFLILRDGYGGIQSLEHVEEESFKVQISCDPEHEFFASESNAVSILVHNVQPIS